MHYHESQLSLDIAKQFYNHTFLKKGVNNWLFFAEGASMLDFDSFFSVSSWVSMCYKISAFKFSSQALPDFDCSVFGWLKNTCPFHECIIVNDMKQSVHDFIRVLSSHRRCGQLSLVERIASSTLWLQLSKRPACNHAQPAELARMAKIQCWYAKRVNDYR